MRSSIFASLASPASQIEGVFNRMGRETEKDTVYRLRLVQQDRKQFLEGVLYSERLDKKGNRERPVACSPFGQASDDKLLIALSLASASGNGEIGIGGMPNATDTEVLIPGKWGCKKRQPLTFLAWGSYGVGCRGGVWVA